MGIHEFTGMLVSAGITIVGFYFTIYRGQKNDWEKTANQRQEQINSTNELTKEMVKLSTNLLHLNSDLEKQSIRVTKHGKEIDNLVVDNIKNKKDIENHESRLKDLEGK